MTGFEEWALRGITIGAIGFVWWSIRGRIKILVAEFKEMNGSIKGIIEKHHACREELPGRFVGITAFLDRKEEVNGMTEKLFDKIDELKIILINGKPKKKKKERR